MEFVFCRMGTRRSTIAAAKSPKSSGFNFTVNSPAITIRCVRRCNARHHTLYATTDNATLLALHSMYCCQTRGTPLRR